MDEHFNLLYENIKLTKAQREDAKIKRNGVSHSLYQEFYGGDYDPSTRLIIGSHGKHTATRYPVNDVDLIFKIDEDTLTRYQAYADNGPSALLRRARKKLMETYVNTSIIRTWGKVVLVAFSEGSHNVEVLPCYENDDGTFTIPNSEGNDGKGSWDIFDPRAEMKMIADSESETGITRQFIKMAKRWRRRANLDIKSYQIEFYIVSFLEEYASKGVSWSQLFEEFMLWLEQQGADYNDEDASKITTARKRAQRAREYELLEDYEDTCNEWRKVFGEQFPLYDKDLETVKNLERLYPTSEQYIQELYPVAINPQLNLVIHADYTEGRSDPHPFAHFFRNVGSAFNKNAKFFFRVSSNIEGEVRYLWKIRNFHDEARDANDLRGEIHDEGRKRTHEEGARYSGTHYVDCYAVVDEVVVAQSRRFVPIGQGVVGE